MKTQMIYPKTTVKIGFFLALLLLPMITAKPAFTDTKPVLGNQSAIPQTAQDHLALATKYENKAAEYRAEAEFHRQMKESYSRKVATTPKSPVENPWVTKMSKHCDQYIQHADILAQEAQKFSDYHHLRAKELQGK